MTYFYWASRSSCPDFCLVLHFCQQILRASTGHKHHNMSLLVFLFFRFNFLHNVSDVTLTCLRVSLEMLMLRLPTIYWCPGPVPVTQDQDRDHSLVSFPWWQWPLHHVSCHTRTQPVHTTHESPHSGLSLVSARQQLKFCIWTDI